MSKREKTQSSKSYPGESPRLRELERMVGNWSDDDDDRDSFVNVHVNIPPPPPAVKQSLHPTLSPAAKKGAALATLITMIVAALVKYFLG